MELLAGAETTVNATAYRRVFQSEPETNLSIAPLNRDENSLKQKRGVVRIADDGRDPTLELRNEFGAIGA